MKKILLIFIFIITQQIVSQDKIGRPFVTGSVNFTLGINENYTLFNDDDESFLVPAAAFFRVGFGYEFAKRVGISFNSGFDYHWNYAVSAFPTYGTLKYNITEDEDDAFFAEVSYGKMWRPSDRYPDGNYYGFGLGVQVAGENRWNTIIRLDFHRKGIYGFENNRLDSVSFGIGFSFF
jgi:hypothetical protein